ncbi:MAG TPA: hypothetical protein VNL38_01075 [Candidatus Nitrosotenuis sp.]|nr:hypothetical protein [Candidatus Nitrosotenuis sp.]
MFLAAVTASAISALAQGGPFASSLSIAVSPSQVNFILPLSGISSGSSPVSITTTWTIQRGGTEVSVYAYFANPPAALSSGNLSIPSSKVFGRLPGGTFMPFTATGPFSPGGSLLVFSQQVRNNKRTTRTDPLDLQIDTTGLNLQPGVYTGTLRIQAIAF